MAYGTPRAIQSEQRLYCIHCTQQFVEEGKIVPRDSRASLRDLACRFPGAVLWEDECSVGDAGNAFEITRTFVEIVLGKDLLAVDRIFVEGQFPDQAILEEHACARCGTRLRDLCTDYP